jgi:multiple sugar transport system substrate-binding protein
MSITRRTLLVTAALGATAGLASCSRGGGTEPDDGDATSIRFAWWGSTPRHEMTEQALDAFGAEHPEITVATEPAEFAAYFDRLATQAAAGDAPDVITLGGAYVAEYAQRGALLDLGTMSAQLDLSPADASVLGNGQVDGTQYAATTGVNALAIVTNPAIFEDAGIELPDDTTWTWEEFEELAAQITAATPDGVYGSAGTLTHDSIDCWARQRGEALYTPDGQLGLTAATLEELFALSLSMIETGAAPPAGVITELEGVPNEQTLLGTGKAAMMLTWSNSLAPMSAASGSPLRLLDVPGESPTPGLWLQSSQFYAISAASQNPQAAATLIDFLLNDPAAATVITTDRGVPASEAMRDAIAPELDENGQAEVDYVAYQAGKDLAQLVIGPAGSTEVAGITTRVLSDLMFGELTPAEAAASWMEQAQQAIA